MFYKGFGSKKQPEQDIAERATVDSDARLGFASSGKPGAIDVLVNASGRVNLGILEKYAETAGRSEFARFMRHPVLAGASIQAGVLALQRQQRRHEVNQTFVFEIDSDENAESVCEGLRHAIYPLIKEQGTHRARNIVTIGRISGNDLVIPDISISKRRHWFSLVFHYRINGKLLYNNNIFES